MRTIIGLILLGWLFAGDAVHARPAAEPPYLAPRVEAGELPPLAERLPDAPRVVDLDAMGREAGRYGGTLHTLVGRPEDVRYLVVWGYARLVGYDATFELQPDILERIEVENDRVFTLHVRPGHRWSDGAPFTAEDFRFYWEDVLHDPELSPAGLPAFLLVDGLEPRFTVLDETTVRYAWDAPNHAFLPALAGARPEYLYQPAHYLKRFHADHAEVSADWVATYRDKSRQYRNTNPDLPSLQPWIHAAPAEDSRILFERNPFFHRVDAEGRQLPYIDRVALHIVDADEIPARVAGGESDLQAYGLSFKHFPLLTVAEAQSDIVVHLWITAKGSEVALYPNLTAEDPAWQELMNDADFRRALSLAIDRKAINQQVFHGLGIAAANSVLRQSPLYDPAFEEAWAVHDPEAADALLDAMGLDRATPDGPRLMPDGTPMALTIATTAEDPTVLEVLRFVADDWSKLGIEASIETMSRSELRERALAGEVVMSAWKGLENAIPRPDTPPWELVPSQAVQLGWPAWGQYAETGGHEGRPVGETDAARLVFLAKAWETAAERDERRAAWLSLLAWHAENVFSIGTVHAVPQPVVRRRSLRNVPKEAIYNWEPGAYFGVYGPPTFWFENEERRQN